MITRSKRGEHAFSGAPGKGLTKYFRYAYTYPPGGNPTIAEKQNGAGMTMERRHEYDGLNLLRVDQRVDSDGDGEIEVGETAWRHVEVNSHHPGALGAQPTPRFHLRARASPPQCGPSAARNRPR